jgi:hypothetical protein
MQNIRLITTTRQLKTQKDQPKRLVRGMVTHPNTRHSGDLQKIWLTVKTTGILQGLAPAAAKKRIFSESATPNDRQSQMRRNREKRPAPAQPDRGLSG